MKRFIVTSLVLLIFSTPARAQDRIIPWIEVNAPRTQAGQFYPSLVIGEKELPMRTYALTGILSWAQVTDTVIVSTRIEQIENVFPCLVTAKPKGLRLVGGIKTINLTKDAKGNYDFSDVDGWRKVAAAAERIVMITGQHAVLLENETAFSSFRDGKTTIDWRRMIDALFVLRESRIVYWWNLPRILPDTPTFIDRQSETTRLVQLITIILPDAVILDGTTAWHESDDVMHKEMIRVVGRDRLQDRLLVTPDGMMGTRRAFRVPEAIARAKQLEGNVNIYTGGVNWTIVAREWKKKSKH